MLAVRRAARPLLPSLPNKLVSWFQISLAQWSFHRRLQEEQAPVLLHMDFADEAARLEIDAVEYCSIFFDAHVSNRNYVNEMETRAQDAGVRSLLIMVDRQGDLGDPDKRERAAAVDKHRVWLEAAARLGCHAIRVNAKSAGEPEEQAKLVADGLDELPALLRSAIRNRPNTPPKITLWDGQTAQRIVKVLSS